MKIRKKSAREGQVVRADGKVGLWPFDGALASIGLAFALSG